MKVLLPPSENSIAVINNNKNNNSNNNITIPISLKHSGYYVTSCTTRFNIQNFYALLTVCLCVLYGCQNKQRLFAPTQQGFPKVFARVPLLASKNTHGSSYPCWIKDTVSKCQVQVSTIEKNYISGLIIEIPIHTRSISNKAVYSLTLIKQIVARCVGTGCFLIRHSNGHTK